MSNANHYQDACSVFPGGVNSPVRAFKNVNKAHPLFIKKAHGSLLIDEEGQEYLDFIGSWGPMICGHAHPVIVEAVKQAASKGLSYGAPTVAEHELAFLIKKAFPQLEQMRFTSSGTEATMTAVRLARAVTQRPYIIKFIGCYHGHNDTLLVDAGSGAATFGHPNSDGVLPSLAAYTLTLAYNNIEQLVSCFKQYPDQIAGVIVEAVAGNMGCIPALPDFLSAIQKCCQDYGSLFIVDEVMTGFRVALGGATQLYGLDPDLITLGKIVGGGLPLAVLGGRACYLKELAPEGPVYHAGTLSGNPCAVAAGTATMKLVLAPRFHEELYHKTEFFCAKLAAQLRAKDCSYSYHFRAGMVSFYALPQAPLNFSEAQQQSSEWFSALFSGLLSRGIYWPPSL